MGTFLIAFKTVLPLFLLVIIGIAFSRSKVNKSAWFEVLNGYSLWIGFPALVIASLMHLKPQGESFLGLILLNSAYIVVCTLLAFPLARIFGLSKQSRRALFLILPFGNIAYLGMPVLTNSFGNEVAPVAAIISAVYVFWLLTLVIILLELTGEGKISAKKIGLNLMKNPLLLSVFVGLIIVLFQINVPEVIGTTVQLLANSVTAVVLFSLGLFLGMQHIGKPKDWFQVLGWVVFTMLLIPFLFSNIAQTIQLNTLQLKATIIDSAMPMGLTPYLLAVKYNAKPVLAARIVVLGTLLSMLIIPFWIVFIQ